MYECWFGLFVRVSSGFGKLLLVTTVVGVVVGFSSLETGRESVAGTCFGTIWFGKHVCRFWL